MASNLKIFIAAVLIGSLLILAPVSQASISYTYATLGSPNAPNGYGNAATGINDSGQVSGYFYSAGFHSFVFDGSTYTALDERNGMYGSVTANSINNNGQVTGYFGSTTGDHGFVYNNGAYTILNNPNALSPGINAGTYAQGINDNGLVTGYFGDATATCNGSICYRGFVYDGATYATLDNPIATFGNTFATGINASGQVSGYYKNATGYHGFVYNGSTYTTLDDPIATFGNTFATGINASGQVSGYYNNATGYHGFVYNGSYTTLDDPSAVNGTFVTGINDSGQVSGIFYSATRSFQGFIATPSTVPVPSAVWLFGSGLGLLSFNRRKIKVIQ